MLRLIPALITVYIALLAALPLAPRELGWYATDAGMRLSAMAPLSRCPQLNKNPEDRRTKQGCRSTSDLNRAHGWVMALLVAFVPYAVAVALAPNSYKPWVLMHDAFRSLR